MQLIALTGLVNKRDVAERLAQALTHTGKTVTQVESSADLAAVVAAANTDVVLLSVAETMHPDALMLLLDGLHDVRPDLDIRQIALIDDRTCDCFPHVRELLEDYADMTLRYPYPVEEALA